jgi:phage shock protein PspC (stress-responsive transcriptional regulator)
MNIAIGILVFQAFVWIAFFGIIIYLIARRIEEKRNETFEDRDN